MREDEIEALLKFDDAKLEVIYRDDLVGKAGSLYTAVIKYKHPVKNFRVNVARAGETRVQAVRDVWVVYNRYRNASPEEKESGVWKYENALGDVEVQLKKVLKEKHNGKN